MANLSDRGAVEAVAARIDWKYVLGLELTVSSFDSSVLSLFRCNSPYDTEARYGNKRHTSWLGYKALVRTSL